MDNTDWYDAFLSTWLCGSFLWPTIAGKVKPGGRADPIASEFDTKLLGVDRMDQCTGDFDKFFPTLATQ